MIETCDLADGEDHSEFYSARADGRRVRLVREFPSLGPTDCAHRYPSWSPDGRHMVYMSGDAIAVGPTARRNWRRDRIVTQRIARIGLQQLGIGGEILIAALALHVFVQRREVGGAQRNHLDP